jgi:riboflavin kinase / FMN adenylyltransferase
MRILDFEKLKLTEFYSKKKAAVTIGVFDGIHKGHMKLLHQVTMDSSLESYVITFYVNPKKILHPESFHGCILTQKQKLEHLEAYGIDNVILIDFSSDFSKLRGEKFFDYITSNIHIKKLIIGSNFKCGINASYTAPMINEYFSTMDTETVIVEQLLNSSNIRISSSYVRQLIMHGEMIEAAEFLDKIYALDFSSSKFNLSDTVISIKKTEIIQLLPPPGLYIVSVDDGLSIINGILKIDKFEVIVKLEKKCNNLKKHEIMIIEKKE